MAIATTFIVVLLRGHATVVVVPAPGLQRVPVLTWPRMRLAVSVVLGVGRLEPCHLRSKITKPCLLTMG